MDYGHQIEQLSPEILNHFKSKPITVFGSFIIDIVLSFFTVGALYVGYWRGVWTLANLVQDGYWEVS